MCFVLVSVYFIFEFFSNFTKSFNASNHRSSIKIFCSFNDKLSKDYKSTCYIRSHCKLLSNNHSVIGANCFISQSHFNKSWVFFFFFFFFLSIVFSITMPNLDSKQVLDSVQLCWRPCQFLNRKFRNSHSCSVRIVDKIKNHFNATFI